MDKERLLEQVNDFSQMLTDSLIAFRGDNYVQGLEDTIESALPLMDRIREAVDPDDRFIFRPIEGQGWRWDEARREVNRLRGLLSLPDDLDQLLGIPPDTTVEVASPAEVEQVEALLVLVRQLEDKLVDSSDEALVLDSEKRALESQLRNPNPNRGVIRSALKGVLWVANAVGGNVLGNAAFELLKRLV